MPQKKSPSKEQFEKLYKNPNPWNIDGTFSDLVRQKILNKLFSKNKFATGIDIGCGEGFMTARMNFVENIIGIDISENAIRRANTFYPDIKFCSGDAFKYNIVDGTYDFVSCFEALYYPSSAKERKKALGLLRSYGSNNTTFAFSVVTIGQNEYRHYFTKKEFTNLLLEMGFVVENIFGFVLGGKKGSSFIIRFFRKLLITFMPSFLVIRLFANITMNVPDDFIYQHLFICKKNVF